MIETAVAKEKHSKREARYEPKATGKDYCGICLYYQPYPERWKGACRVVEGDVNFEGWSKYFRKKPIEKK